MIILPPVEQYKSEYNIINAQVFNSQGGGIFQEQFLTIIAPDHLLDSILIDNTYLSPSIFVPVHNSGFSYANISTTDGQHQIIASSPIAVLVYGYGEAVSYAYIGGMSINNLLENNYIFNSNICSNSATITYHESYNSGIKSYEIIEQYNCNITDIEQKT